VTGAIHTHWPGRAALFGLVLIAAVVLFLLLRQRASHLVAWLGKRLPARFPPRVLILLVLILGAAGTFAEIAEDVWNRETSEFDRSVSLAIHGLHSPFMDFTMRLFTTIGSLKVVIVALVPVVVYAIRRRDRRAAYSLLGTFGASEILNWVIKHLVARARPNLFEEIATLHTYSFPSGHAMTGAAVYGMIGVVLAREHPRLRWPLAAAVPVLVLLIGLSRIYLGVHWPTDVLAGWAAGMTLMLVGFAALVLPARARRSAGSRKDTRSQG
jgi:membrane-associated phospholipid phosphatase